MASDGEAKEAMTLFGNICVTSLAQLPKITAEMEKLEKIKVATRVPADKAASLVALPTQKDNVWVMKSPATKQPFMIVYDTRGICSMQISDASKDGMGEEFYLMVNGIAKVFQGELKPKPSIRQGDTTLRYVEIVRPQGVSFAAALSEADKPAANGTKYLLTFNQIEAAR